MLLLSALAPGCASSDPTPRIVYLRDRIVHYDDAAADEARLELLLLAAQRKLSDADVRLILFHAHQSCGDARRRREFPYWYAAAVALYETKHIGRGPLFELAKRALHLSLSVRPTGGDGEQRLAELAIDHLGAGHDAVLYEARPVAFGADPAPDWGLGQDDIAYEAIGEPTTALPHRGLITFPLPAEAPPSGGVRLKIFALLNGDPAELLGSWVVAPAASVAR